MIIELSLNLLIFSKLVESRLLLRQHIREYIGLVLSISKPANGKNGKYITLTVNCYSIVSKYHRYCRLEANNVVQKWILNLVTPAKVAIIEENGQDVYYYNPYL